MPGVTISAKLHERFAHGALMGARGNSGTILSQLLQGFADGLDNAPLLTDELFARACQAAVKRGIRIRLGTDRKAPSNRRARSNGDIATARIRILIAQWRCWKH